MRGICSCGCARRARTWPIIALAVAVALIPNLAYAVAGNFSSAATGTAGVKGTNTSNGTGAKGAIGYVSSTGTAINYGVYGLTKSRGGRGVLGYASATTGTTYGVYGRTDSANGFGVYSFGNLGILLGKNIVCTGCVQPQGLATSSGTPSGNVLTTLDPEGEDVAMTIGADGLGIIAHHDGTNEDLEVAHCNNTACTSVTKTSILTAGDVGDDPEIVIGSDGLALITSDAVDSGDLRATHCSNIACTAATTTTLDSSDDARSSSSTIGTDGFALITYIDGDDDLKTVHCTNVTCSAFTGPFTLDAEADQDPTVAIGADGLGLIAYNDISGVDDEIFELGVAHCSNIACSTATTITVDTSDGVGEDASITIGADGLGLIAYMSNLDSGDDADLKIAHCVDILCGTVTASVVDTTDDMGINPSITIGPDGLGLVSYWDVDDENLKVGHCVNVACTAVTSLIVDGDVGDEGETEIAIGADGLALIAYVDESVDDLKVVHCANPFCLPYWQRR